MSNDKKTQEQELKKLEDQAYFELCQIIAEAMQYQDVELLDARIASWKTKYRKLLDRPSTSSKSDFKKRIEFLLTQYYSSVTQYILNQLKLKEEKKVENQSRALRQLYKIIKDTNDLNLLKKKVKKWEDKYPVDGFLRMYQKRIELYTREKNLKENAFNQEEAFSNLVDITKKYATIDELKEMIENWEKKYSINDKYSIDDFIKHQSEVKRFISDEFLQSIARDNPNITYKSELDIAEKHQNKSFSDLSIQASSYAALVSISKSPNSVDEMFRWVYENRHIKFSDKYKELILSATYLDYSPTYLNKLKVPNMDMSKSSLSYDEYKNIEDIKRYAIISYFNLLLPPEKAISNDYFTKHIQTVYAKSERARTTSKIEDSSLYVDDMLNSGVEISLKSLDENYIVTEKAIDKEIIDSPTESLGEDIPNISKNISNEDKIDISEKVLDKDVLDTPEKVDDSQTQNQELEAVIDLSKIDQILNSDLEDEKEINNEAAKTTNDSEKSSQEDIPTFKEDSTWDFDLEQGAEKTVSLNLDPSPTKLDSNDNEENIDYDAVVTFSPLFIVAVNNLDKQATIVDHIDSDVTKYVESEKAQEISLYKPVKIKTDE